MNCIENSLKEAISESIERATGSSFAIEMVQSVSGGCINQAFCISGNGKNFFVKCNRASAVTMFSAESSALKTLAATGSIRVPQPVGFGKVASQSYLVLEALRIGTPGPDNWQTMGQQLARLHRSTSSLFGWHRDNTIGTTPQSNTQRSDWTEFFLEQRLRPQLKLAARQGMPLPQTEALPAAAGSLLAGHSPAPSLLHGDLWSGNAGFLECGTPVLFDPATYYGDRETDLAFSEFFGGFPSAFYEAYEAEWPVNPGYSHRKTLYNLYHVLNHANLFGGGYVRQAAEMIRHLVQA